MDVLRKELNIIYSSQNVGSEWLDPDILEMRKTQTCDSVSIEDDCRVITDASADVCFIYGGSFAKLFGLHAGKMLYFKAMNSSDEDDIYNRIHPEDLVEKRMLEYEFFKFVDKLPADDKLRFKATCRIRIRNSDGNYLYVDNITRILQLSPKGKIWLILCTYGVSPAQETATDISPRIVNTASGEVRVLSLNENRSHILTDREKEILLLIKDGQPSKQIAWMLGISVHTVNRHRQNILEKLSVGNSVEAIKAAVEMRLL